MPRVFAFAKGIREGEIFLPSVYLVSHRLLTDLWAEELGQEMFRRKYGRGQLCELFKDVVFEGY